MTAARAIAAGALLGVTLAVPSHPVEVMRPVAIVVGVLVFCSEVLGAVSNKIKAGRPGYSKG